MQVPIHAFSTDLPNLGVASESVKAVIGVELLEGDIAVNIDRNVL